MYVRDGKIWEAFPALKYYLHCGLIVKGLYYGFDLLDQSVICILSSDFFYRFQINQLSHHVPQTPLQQSFSWFVSATCSLE